ncbi:MAG: hypothetical protein PHC62_00475 [Candidatus Izemoplasmatales bacterium]|nr:hypothetical protein [Candidatus Izemoplasmatales bacterium]
MISADLFRQYLKDNLKPWARDAGGYKEILTRCPYCPDSKDPNKGHMYISVPFDEKLSFFNCAKCNTHGVLTPTKLIEWGITDVNFMSDLSSYNKKVSNLPQNKMLYKEGMKFNVNHSFITDDKLSRYKLKYLNDRLGANLTLDDCKQLKIILNLSDLFKVNSLKPTRDETIMSQLDYNFMGFLSIDNAFVNLRNLEIQKNIYQGINRRYINYDLFGKYDNSQRFYTMPANIDLTRPVTLHIAEGSFDILSIYLNLPNNTGNDIYTSISGKGYKGIIRYFISQKKLPWLNIHIYPDNDITRKEIWDVVESFKVFNFPISIHRNLSSGQKDFGVDPKHIQEVIEKIN